MIHHFFAADSSRGGEGHAGRSQKPRCTTAKTILTSNYYAGWPTIRSSVFVLALHHSIIHFEVRVRWSKTLSRTLIKRSAPGIEPGTSSTLRKNHAPRPSGRSSRLSSKHFLQYSFCCQKGNKRGIWLLFLLDKNRHRVFQNGIERWVFLPFRVSGTWQRPKSSVTMTIKDCR